MLVCVCVWFVSVFVVVFVPVLFACLLFACLLGFWLFASCLCVWFAFALLAWCVVLFLPAVVSVGYEPKFSDRGQPPHRALPKTV